MKSNLSLIAKGGNFAKKLQSTKFSINNRFNLNKLMTERIKDPSYMLKNMKLDIKKVGGSLC